MTMPELIYMAEGYRKANDPEEIKRREFEEALPTPNDIKMLMRKHPD